MINDFKNSTSDLKKYAIALTAFAFVCLISAWFFNQDSGDRQTVTFRDFMKPEGEVKEFQTDRNHQVFELNALYSTSKLKVDRDWVNANLEIQSPTNTRLFGYSFSFFQEWRTNSEGDDYRYSKNKETVKITLPYKGTYKLKVNGKTNVVGIQNHDLNITLKPKQASSLPFLWTGIISLILGVATAWISSKKMNI